MKKKLFSSLVALTLVVSLTACSESKTAKPAEQKPATTPTTTPAPKPAATPAATPKFGGPATFALKAFQTQIITNVALVLPDKNWGYKQPNDYSTWVYNVPDVAKADSASPLMQITVRRKIEDLDFYKDDFKNLKNIESRTIGGVKMAGRTYEQSGLQWTEYLATLPNTCAISFKITRISTAPNSEGNAVLNSITFK